MNVRIMSRKAMEEHLAQGVLENTSIISFYDPIGSGKRRKESDYRPIFFEGKCENVFSVAIHDLDPEALADFGLTVEGFFPEATELARFIYDAKNENRDIICQCEYGQSRSAACAAAIIEHFFGSGIEIFADYRYYPNQLVYHKVYDALREYEKSEG